MPILRTWADENEDEKKSEMKWPESYGENHEYMMPCIQ